MRPAPSALGFAVVLLAGSAGNAAAVPAAFYSGGILSFSYQPVPFGARDAFRSEGAAIDPSAFPAGGSGVTTARYAEANGTAYLLVAGGTVNADGSVDAALLFLRGPAPLAPGTFAVDPLDSVLFAFVDDAAAVVLPEDLSTSDIDAWARSIPATRRLLGTAGTIRLAVADSGRLQGLFSLTAMDVSSGLPVLVPDGIFSLGATSPVGDASWGSVKAGYGR
jgi:hypothetical protein